MGVCLDLDILPCSIEPRAWTKAWDDSLRLLRAHPSRLVGLDSKEHGQGTRLVYTRELERRAQTPEWHWHVVGDRRSGLVGESVLLYRDLRHYEDGGRPRRAKGDAAVELRKRDLEVASRNPLAPVFDNVKTQGHPYHEALVAVVSLLEHCLGSAAFASGDLDATMTRRACTWAGKVLGRKIELPVCFRPDALFQRLEGHFEGDALLDTCIALNAGPEDEMIMTLVSRVDRGALERWFARGLEEHAHGEDANELRLDQAFATWFRATDDLDSLVSLACVHEAGPRMSPADLARAVTAARRAAYEGPEGAFAMLAAALVPSLPMTSKPRTRWPSSRIVAKRLVRRFPAQRTAIEAAIAETESKSDESDKVLARLARRRLQPDALKIPRVLGKDGLPENEEGLVLRGAAFATWRAAADLVERPGLTARVTDPDSLRELIAARLDADSEPLFEDVWEALDAEPDPDFLRFILALVAVEWAGPLFKATRTLLADVDLCRRLHRASGRQSWRRAIERFGARSAEILRLESSRAPIKARRH